MKKSLFVSVSVLFLASNPVIADGHADVVREFVAAFSAHDVDAMLAFVHPDIEWISVNGASTSVEAAGRDALRDSMAAYFASCPSCRSEVTIGNSHGDFVSAVETASWEVDGERKRQSSLSVYQFEDDLIRYAWYFPVTN